MSPVSRGKQFEDVIRRSFEKVPNTQVIRMPDPTMGYLGIRNFCDFIVYHYPRQYCIECKSIHGNTFPFSNITDNQWNGLLEASKIKGVVAGIICWWVDKGITRFLPIEYVNTLKSYGEKSIRYDFGTLFGRVIFPELDGKKKRVYFDYDMEVFFDEV